MQFFAYQIGWYRLQCLFDCKNEAGFMWQRKHFRSSTQVLSIAIEAGFVLGVIHLLFIPCCPGVVGFCHIGNTAVAVIFTSSF